MLKRAKVDPKDPPQSVCRGIRLLSPSSNGKKQRKMKQKGYLTGACNQIFSLSSNGYYVQDGRTKLLTACMRGDLDVVEVLLKKGVDANQETIVGGLRDGFFLDVLGWETRIGEGVVEGRGFVEDGRGVWNACVGCDGAG